MKKQTLESFPLKDYLFSLHKTVLPEANKSVKRGIRNVTAIITEHDRENDRLRKTSVISR